MARAKLIVTGFINEIGSVSKSDQVFYTAQIVYQSGRQDDEGNFAKQYLSCLVDKSLNKKFEKMLEVSTTDDDGRQVHQYSSVLMDLTVKLPYFTAVAADDGKVYLNGDGILIDYSRN